jgi:hypothetical protein
MCSKVERPASPACAGRARLLYGRGVVENRRQAIGGARSVGFTILEVLLSIAIVGLVAAVLIGGSSHLLSEKAVTPYDVFWKAVVEARKAALKAEHDIRLKFDKDKRQFVLIDGIAPATLAPDGITREEKALKQFPIPVPAGTELSVDFLPAATKSGAKMVLVGGVAMELQSVKHVTFYSDGTCSPFRVQFVRNGATSTALVIDPWTCAPVLPSDPNTTAGF